jgi:hypothetical protein
MSAQSGKAYFCCSAPVVSISTDSAFSTSYGCGLQAPKALLFDWTSALWVDADPLPDEIYD